MLKKAEKYVTCAENFVNGILIFVGIVVLFINIMMRYFFSAASTWVEEALRYSIIWVTFLGGSQCAKLGTHVGIDLMIQVMPKGIQRYFNGLAQFIAAAFTAICAYAGVQTVNLVVETAQKSPAMFMPMWVVYLAIPVGCLLMTVRFTIAGILAIRDKGGGSLLTDDDGNMDMSRM